MDRWAGKVAIVTGASSGIGLSISTSLVKHGVKVAGLARRIDKLQELARTLGEDQFCPIRCDLQKEEDILSAFKKTEEKWGGVDILVNNAGVATDKPIIDSPTSEYRKLIDTNLIAPAICTREFAQSIKKRNATGHVININSRAGRFAESIAIPLGMYSASKYGLRALGVELRHEFMAAKLKIKITNISPGTVYTEMFKELAQYNPDALKNTPMLRDKDIADATIYALETPEETEIIEVTVMPRGSPIVIVKNSKRHIFLRKNRNLSNPVIHAGLHLHR